ncbi:FlgD immunoglobulin-like domain containing protein [Tumebacillus permanentifrigoris]|uniref:Subtilisin family serine protease n=1 Tax=Tumebacillus permanentifrigoris TaxID=378543 RepID=A0A316D8Y9_9BACL|nr:FlgD immunoglobulin-like domain containing protein [Tumebacillus permanentifrigoris]PWK13446.1 subtilisin family serine protease [Tumebacillus permanentifrigoris]
MQGSRGTTSKGWKLALAIGAGFAITGWFTVTPAHAEDSKFIEMNTLSEQQLSARVAEVLADPTTFTAGDLIVKYKPGTDATQIANKHAASVSKKNANLRLGKLKVNNAALKQTYMDLVRDPEVEYVQPNYKYSLSATSNDPNYSAQWSLPRMHVPEAWGYSKGDSSMVIAVVDSGVRTDHPDLAASLLPGINTITNDSNVNDDNGHGTHVSGIAAGIIDNGVGISGVAGKAKILPIKAMNASGQGYDIDIAEGITWAADHGAKVINLSLGSPSFSQTTQDAINYAWSKGILIVAAAGNSNSAAAFYPAAGDHVLSVMATDENNARASFSNYGTTVDIAAPGTSIYATTYDGGYGYKQGTSMASPNVAGVAALVWNYRPTLTNAQLEKVLESSTIDLGAAGKDTTFGYGLINAYTAMTAVVDTTPIGLTVTGVTPNPFNPLGTNTSTISYSIAEPGNVTLKILDSNNNVVKTVLNNVAVTTGTKTGAWDGKNSAGQIVAEGVYSYVLSATDAWGNNSTPLTGTIKVDRTAPVLSAASITPSVFVPTGSNTAAINYTLSENAKVTVGIYNSSNALVKAITTNAQQNAGANSVLWDGKTAAGVIANDGNYTYKITVTDYVNLSGVAASGAISIDRFKPELTKVTDTPDPFKVTGLTNSTISYTLSEDANVSVKIYNSTGSVVRTLQNALLPYGVKSVVWNGKNDAGALVDDGTYTYKINATDRNNNVAPEVTGTITTDKTLPVITSSTTTLPIAPGTGTATLSYTLSENAKVTSGIYNSAGALVKALDSNIAKTAGTIALTWDGKNTAGVFVPDGVYTLKINAVDAVGWTATPVSVTITAETGAAKFTAVTATPNPFKVTGTANATIAYTLSENATLTLKLYDANGTLVRTLVNAVATTFGPKSVLWNGKNDAGALVADGVYTYKLNATDSAGNVSSEATGTITTDKTAPTVTPSGTPVTFKPGTSTASIAYTLSESAKVTIAVYNSAGALVKTLATNIANLAGSNSVVWDGKNASNLFVAAGTYTVKITATDALGWISTPVSFTITAQ